MFPDKWRPGSASKLLPRVASALAASAILFIGGLSPAVAGRISPDLRRQIISSPNSNRLVRVIVQFSKPGVNTGGLARIHGGLHVFDHPFIHASTLLVPENQISSLAAEPGVASVTPDRPLQALATWTPDYALQTLAVDQAWSGYMVKGTGVGIAVLDSGVDPDADFNRYNGAGSRIIGWQDFVNGESMPYDDNGHGTHVAGIALGSGNLSQGNISGPAPDANLIAVKVLDSTGCGYVSSVINGIQWCIQNQNVYNIRIINLSLGMLPQETYAQDPLCQAAESAVKAGIVVICAAGNLGKNAQGVTQYGGINSPGDDPRVITVGALDTMNTPERSDDFVDTYSSRGPTLYDQLVKPDVVAPGNKIVSVRAPGSYLDVNFPANQIAYSAATPSVVNYFQLSGTSMATPEVSGVVALMLQANPSLDPQSVKGILMLTAQPMNLKDSSGHPLSQGLSILTQGAGSVNAVAAVETAAKVDTTQPVGNQWLKGPLSKQTTIGGETFNWAEQILYGNQVLWGDDLIQTRQVLWSDQVLWGDQVLWSDQVLWADDGVSSDQQTWSDDMVSSNTEMGGDSTSEDANLEMDSMMYGD